MHPSEYVPNEDDRSSTKDDTAPTCQLPSRHERALVISRSEQASSRVYPGPLQVVGLRLSAEPVRTALGGASILGATFASELREVTKPLKTGSNGESSA